ncbi:hypothetical protein [Geothrix sp. 21YS21S-2]|uniref:hypothetical protein n=1 Tax=Geothrix sp. 21YS21S-2 TaxID=3068893 RepID=UPI0027B98A13|nr:hypothetical protein [Geothrix sp. 21YS21S-2]
MELRRGLRRAADQLSDDLQEAGFQVPCGAPPGEPALAQGSSGDLIIIMDEVVPVRGHLCAPLPVGDPVPLSRRVRLSAEGRVRLVAGDVLLVEDGAWEGLRLAGPLELQPREVGEGIGTVLEGEVPRAHGDGAPVSFLRPLHRVVWRLEGSLLVRRCGEERGRVLADRVAAFRVDLGAPPAALVTLEARGPAGERCALTLTRVPRNGAPP